MMKVNSIYMFASFLPAYSPHNGQIRHRTHLSVNHTVIDDESRRLIDDANLLIDRDNLLLLEVIGQGRVYFIFFNTQDFDYQWDMFL